MNGVLVGEATYRATRDVIDYGDASPVEAKGKSQPIAVWEVCEARSRFGVDVPQIPRTPLVSREREFGLLPRPCGFMRRKRSSNQGRRAEADAQIAKALAFYRSVGATHYIREGEALLAATA